VSGLPRRLALKSPWRKLLPSPPGPGSFGHQPGPNVGINVLYSGTVSAATEAAILGVKGWPSPWTPMTERRLRRRARWPGNSGAGPWLGRLEQRGLPQRQPAEPARAEVKGSQGYRQDTGPLVEPFRAPGGPAAACLLLAGGNQPRPALDPDTDYGALAQGYVSITHPTTTSLTTAA